MAFRYFLSLIFVIIVLMFNGFSWRIYPNIVHFIDIPLILIVLICPLIFMGILNGWKNIGAAFTIVFNKSIDKKDLLSAKTFFKIMAKQHFYLRLLPLFYLLRI